MAMCSSCHYPSSGIKGTEASCLEAAEEDMFAEIKLLGADGAFEGR
jgi:hypothetical protein